MDLAALAERCTAAGALLAVDSTFATPVLQRPLELGADVVVHSVTKFLSGHSDLLLGVAVAHDADVATRLVETRSVLGALPGTVEAWLALRGLRTLHLRIERASANAAELARRLAGHTAVSTVHYPGFGAMVSVDLRGAPQAAELVCESTELWVHATSLGGVESSPGATPPVARGVDGGARDVAPDVGRRGGRRGPVGRHRPGPAARLTDDAARRLSVCDGDDDLSVGFAFGDGGQALGGLVEGQLGGDVDLQRAVGGLLGQGLRRPRGPGRP